MPDDLSPTLGRWELGRTLRRIRESQGKTIEQVAQDLSDLYATGFSASKISRLETGRRGAIPRDVRDLCDYYGIDAAERDRLVDLARTTRSETHLQGVFEAYQQYVAYEAVAHIVRMYEPMFVPGLLQTVDYQRAAIDSYALAGIRPGSTDPKSKAEIQIRTERQRRLHEPNPLIVKAIIDENVLRRRVGSTVVMSAQFAHLTELSLLPNISLRVIPASRGIYPGCQSAGFSLLAFDEGEAVPENLQFVEGLVGDVWAESSADRLYIARTFEHLGSIALGVDESRRLIIDAAHQMA